MIAFLNSFRHLKTFDLEWNWLSSFIDFSPIATQIKRDSYVSKNVIQKTCIEIF